MPHAVTFLIGVLFALGLGLGGMTNANKVVAFLDPLHGWDPSLGLVMAGAIGAHLLLWNRITSRESPLFEQRFRIPTRSDIDGKLVAGAALFGAGWGIGGYCPGPGLVSVSSGASAALIFVGAMTIGMALFHVAETSWAARASRREVERPTAEPRPEDIARQTA